MWGNCIIAVACCGNELGQAAGLPSRGQPVAHAVACGLPGAAEGDGWGAYLALLQPDFRSARAAVRLLAEGAGRARLGRVGVAQMLVGSTERLKSAPCGRMYGCGLAKEASPCQAGGGTAGSPCGRVPCMAWSARLWGRRALFVEASSWLGGAAPGSVLPLGGLGSLGAPRRVGVRRKWTCFKNLSRVAVCGRHTAVSQALSAVTHKATLCA